MFKAASFSEFVASCEFEVDDMRHDLLLVTFSLRHHFAARFR